MRRTGHVRHRMTFLRRYKLMVAVGRRPKRRADLRLRISGVIQGVGAVREDLLVLVRRGGGVVVE